MFQDFIVQPIFNLLVLIYALIPGHDFGMAIILFTIVVRVAMWPLLKKQLHQTRLMRILQPKVKEIKQKTKGNRQKEGQMLAELYKEYGVNPFSSLALLFVQLPVFIGLFNALRRLIGNPQAILDFSYSWVLDLGHMKTIAADISKFDDSFLGLVNATQHAIGQGSVVWPALIISLLAGVFQYFQTRQLTPKDERSKTLSQIMRESAQGKEVDQGEINSAVGRNIGRFFAPLIAYISAVSPAGLALYFTTSGLVGLLQQRFILNRDVQELEAVADKTANKEATVKVRRLTEAEKKSRGTRRQRRKS